MISYIVNIFPIFVGMDPDKDQDIKNYNLFPFQQVIVYQ